MISPLIDLETRRKILFVDDYFTIRSIGADSVLITISAGKASREAIENARGFLRCRSQLTAISSVIIDITQSTNLTLLETLSFSKIKHEGLQRFAVLSKKLKLRLMFPLLRLYIPSAQFRLFKDLTTAIAWTKASETN